MNLEIVDINSNVNTLEVKSSVVTTLLDEEAVITLSLSFSSTVFKELILNSIII